MNDLQVKSERPLTGEWRYSDGYLYCGTIRIGALSLDTNPTDEVRDEIGEWICKKLNANDSDEDARGASELMRMVSLLRVIYKIKHQADRKERASDERQFLVTDLEIISKIATKAIENIETEAN
nr:hypothetical protein 40 [Balneolaceae bacterium]